MAKRLPLNHFDCWCGTVYVENIKAGDNSCFSRTNRCYSKKEANKNVLYSNFESKSAR
jgi:hypothetical protein